VGSAVIVLVLAWWGVGLREGLSWWSLPAAALLLAAHVGALVASYGPVDLPVDRAVVRLWTRRAVALLGSSVLVLALARWVRDAPEPPGVWLAGLAAAIVAVLGGSLVFSRTRGQV
jgi:hypothetical protein